MSKEKTNKNIKAFAWAAFLNDFGAEMIYPIWPIFVTTVLGAPMSALGLIDGLGDAMVSISQAVSGYISDRIRKRKVFIWLGYFFGGLSRIGYAFSTVWQMLIPFRILDRAGKIRGAPRDAMVADLSTHENRGRSFGILRMMDNLGGVTGICFTILLVNYLGLKTLFLIAAVPSAIAIFIILFFVKEKPDGNIKIFKGLRLSDLNKNLRLFFFLSTIFSLGTFSYSFLLIFAKGLGFRVAMIPVFYLVFSAVASISSLPFGILSDRIGRKSVLQLAFLFWGLVCVTLILLNSLASVFAAFVFYGLHKGSLDTVQKAFVAELSPKDYRASVLGGFQMVIGLAALPASLLAGFLWDFWSPSTPFFLSLGLTAFAAILLSFVKETGHMNCIGE